MLKQSLKQSIFVSKLTSSFFGLAALAATAQASAQAGTAQFGLSPDNNQSVAISAIQSAQSSLLINIYQFDSPAILAALTDAISRGVTVKILIEGQPLPEVTAAGKKVIAAIQKAMKASSNSSNRIFLMKEADSNHPRRYKYDHAKYMVIDGTSAYLSSENFTSTGHPNPGAKGNRGWVTHVQDRGLANQLAAIFKKDANSHCSDIVDLTQARTISAPTKQPASGDEHRQNAPIAVGSGTVKLTKLIVSPQSGDGLNEFMASASHSLDLQQMSFPTNWKMTGSGDPLALMIQGALAAASRGAQVRALLNDDLTFGSSPSANSNLNAAKFLNQEAKCKNLSIEGRIVDVKAIGITYIHNKGMLADGQRALVSSINGTQNSIENNRETAVWLESADAAEYFGAAFDSDWSISPATTATRSDLATSQCPSGAYAEFSGAPLMGYLGITH